MSEYIYQVVCEVNSALNEDGLHVGGMVGFAKSIRYSCDILKPSRCIVVFDGKGGSKRRKRFFQSIKELVKLNVD